MFRTNSVLFSVVSLLQIIISLSNRLQGKMPFIENVTLILSIFTDNNNNNS